MSSRSESGRDPARKPDFGLEASLHNIGAFGQHSSSLAPSFLPSSWSPSSSPRRRRRLVRLKGPCKKYRFLGFWPGGSGGPRAAPQGHASGFGRLPGPSRKPPGPTTNQTKNQMINKKNRLSNRVDVADVVVVIVVVVVVVVVSAIVVVVVVVVVVVALAVVVVVAAVEVPLAFDQPFWAQRLEELGVGARLELEQLTVEPDVSVESGVGECPSIATKWLADWSRGLVCGGTGAVT
jgi:hypothetical protein